MEAKELIFAGARWRVGSGKQILISGQPWLVEDNTVASLMCTDYKVWDIDLVKDLFNDRDQKCILSLNVDSDNTEDVLFWRFDRGNYSVKSAYNFLQEQKGNWRVDHNVSIWNLLWLVKAPPKCLNLVWRALSYCLQGRI